MSSAEVRNKLVETPNSTSSVPAGNWGIRRKFCRSRLRADISSVFSPRSTQSPSRLGNLDADEEVEAAAEAGLDDDLTPLPAETRPEPAAKLNGGVLFARLRLF